MRTLAISVLLLCTLISQAQTTAPDPQSALIGAWVGTLEYRDYSEPETSTKRVKLPTWLKIESSGRDLHFSYVYDDGPNKTVTEDELIHIDVAISRYERLGKDRTVQDSFQISGLASLKDGRGTLVMTGPGKENNAAVDVRLTLRIERNILEITKETSSKGHPFTFRDAYTFVRAAPPVRAATP